jgi:hypothetical protein
MKRDLLAAQLGRTRPVLVEGMRRDERGTFAAGFTPNYLPVRLRGADTGLVNQTLQVRLESLTSDGEALNAIPLT